MNKMRNLGLLCLVSLMIIVLIEARGLGSGKQDEGVIMSPPEFDQAMKYLFNFDRYYADVGYPRYELPFNPREEKRQEGEKKPIGRFLALQGLDNRLSHMSRPRFGKRGGDGYLEPYYNIGSV
ncbi:uncharacterized protein [Lepeophtheirus salmonis]|nr:uncharacterized protein LOC121118815 isoform X2 [Lepeophtheirus salmonis]